MTVANNIFLIDLWWAPAVDDQAIDRVYRLGQTKTVSVSRFLVESSIENRIYDIQKEKRRLAESAFEHVDKKKTNKEMIGRLLDLP